MAHAKQFYVVAYDVSDDKRRGKVVKVLQRCGKRINLSVFECMLTEAQYRDMKNRLLEVCDRKKDHILIYPLCLNCFSKIENIAGNLSVTEETVAIV